MKRTELSQLTADGARYFLTCEAMFSVWTFSDALSALQAQAALKSLYDWRAHDGGALADYDFERLVKFLMTSLEGPVTVDQLTTLLQATTHHKPRPIFDVIEGGAAPAPAPIVLGVDWGEPGGDHTAVASLDKFGGVSVEVLKHRGHRGHRGDGFTLADEPALGDPPDNVGRLARWLRPRK